MRRDEQVHGISFLHLFHCRKLQAAQTPSYRQLEEALRRLDARVERAASTALQCSEGALRPKRTWIIDDGRAPNNFDDVR